LYLLFTIGIVIKASIPRKFSINKFSINKFSLKEREKNVVGKSNMDFLFSFVKEFRTERRIYIPKLKRMIQ
jgi:hypothetical protein